MFFIFPQNQAEENYNIPCSIHVAKTGYLSRNRINYLQLFGILEHNQKEKGRKGPREF
jgi:hypothetical protein